MTSALRDLVDLTVVVDPTFDQNCYVLHRRDTDDVVLVDTGLQHRKVLDLLEQRRLRCSQILLTHGHPDHVSGVPAVKAAHGCPAAIHPDDREMLEYVTRLRVIPPDLPPVVAETDLVAGTPIAWQGLEILPLHTPGHTRGSMCFVVGPDVLSGDTLFQRGVGRTDLPGGDWNALLLSIEGTLYTLPPETVVHPGHGSSTTIREEMRYNPFVVHPTYR